MFPRTAGLSALADSAPGVLTLRSTRFKPAATGFRGLRDGFIANAKMRPNNVALRLGERSYTYAEANDIARRWASRLLDVSALPPRRIGVFAYRDETAYIGVLASLFAGAAFVPLNRKFPVERTRAMLEQADVDAVLVDDESLPQLADALSGLSRPPAIFLPQTETAAARHAFCGVVLGRDDLANAAPLSVLPDVTSGDMAYLLFTSGSTGQPKGVPITHGNVRAFLDMNLARYRLTPADRLTQTFDQTFDLSVFDLFMAWESGASVCGMEAIQLLAPFRFLDEQQITVWFSVPSVAALLLKRKALTPGRMPRLRWSLFCGEGLPRGVAEAWQSAAPNSVLENLYGPTELTIACAAYRWNPVTSPGECINDLVPIGEVYPHLSHIVVDEDLRDVTPGQLGELCVAGSQASPGYWRAPHLTASRFFERTGPAGISRRFYRTGDLVRVQANHYTYVGRNDQQIKVAGYRIELGEVEAALRRAGAVDCVALAWPTPDRVEHIVAVVSGVSDTAALGAVAAQQLPNYMMPRAIHLLDEMPLNANGKVDRGAVRRWIQANREQSI